MVDEAKAMSQQSYKTASHYSMADWLASAIAVTSQVRPAIPALTSTRNTIAGASAAEHPVASTPGIPDQTQSHGLSSRAMPRPPPIPFSVPSSIHASLCPPASSHFG